MQTVKNIIFDLGGVLIDIDFKLTEKAFHELGVENFADFYTLKEASALFQSLETGMDIDAFYDAFRQQTARPFTNEQIQDAWNALLMGFRKNSIYAFSGLRQKYRLFLLSNTNEIHLQAFHKMYEKTFDNGSFDELFHEAFYSHRIGCRKPDAAAFEFVLGKQQLNPAETLFIDDLSDNIQAARKLGMQTVHLQKGMFIENLGL